MEARPVLYNCRDPNHSKKHVLHLTWKELAVGLKINGVEKNGMCVIYVTILEGFIGVQSEATFSNILVSTQR